MSRLSDKCDKKDDPFHREFQRALSKTDLFRVLKIASKRHLCSGFAIIDTERLKAERVGLESATILKMLPSPGGRGDIDGSDYRTTIEWLRKNRRLACIRPGDHAFGSLAQYYDAQCVHIFPAGLRTGSNHALIVLSDSAEPISGEAIFDFTAILFRLVPLVAEHKGAMLSTREIETVEWTAAGKTSGEIATILGLSEHTVNEYIHSAMKKTDAVNRIHLVANSIRNGVIF